MLKAAYRRTRKDGAAGIDGVTGAAYEADLEKNITDLYDRLRTQRYRAPAVRRAYIPKEDGSKRPLGIPTFEDKIVQRATLMVMEQLYEQDFYDCSYGFRPGKSAHQALEAVKEQCRQKNIQYILDVDVKGFFDSVDHEILQSLVARRIKDAGIRRLIGKWLNAGIQEQGITKHPGVGTPQGGVISPLLANIYLHHVLDEWFIEEVMPRLKGRSFLVRYADDFVIGFEEKEDAQRVMAVIGKRFERYKLKLHPTKTRLVLFQRPPWKAGERDHESGTFTFLGFTHSWTKSPRTNGWYIRRRIASKRFGRSLRNVKQWLKVNRHKRIAIQHTRITKHLRGFYNYYGLPDNLRPMHSYRRLVERAWYYWLNRRGGRHITWDKFSSGILTYFHLPLCPNLLRRAATCRA
jgi:group II intron reverse transcriptase/maturase